MTKSVSILSNIHCGRWLVKCIRHDSEGQRPPPPQTKAAQVSEVIHPLCSERLHPAVFWVSSREKKTLPVLIHAATPPSDYPETVPFFFSFSVYIT